MYIRNVGKARKGKELRISEALQGLWPSDK